MSKKKDAEINRIFLADYRSNTVSEVMAERDAAADEIERLRKLVKDAYQEGYYARFAQDMTYPRCLYNAQQNWERSIVKIQLGEIEKEMSNE